MKAELDTFELFGVFFVLFFPRTGNMLSSSISFLISLILYPRFPYKRA